MGMSKASMALSGISNLVAVIAVIEKSQPQVFSQLQLFHIQSKVFFISVVSTMLVFGNIPNAPNTAGWSVLNSGFV